MDMLKWVSGGSGVEVARWAWSETLAPTFAFPFLAIFSLRLRSTHVTSLSALHRACHGSCGFPSTDYFAPLMHLLLPWGREHDRRPGGHASASASKSSTHNKHHIKTQASTPPYIWSSRESSDLHMRQAPEVSHLRWSSSLKRRANPIASLTA